MWLNKDFTDEDLYKMLVKYFTYKDDTIFLLNTPNSKLFKKITDDEKRKIKTFNFFKF